MFNSGITVQALLTQLKGEVDIAQTIDDATYVDWLTSLEQLLYSDFIREQAEHTFDNVTNNPASIPDYGSFTTNLPEDSILAVPRFEDIHAVYANDVQLIRSTVASGTLFPNTYYKNTKTGKLGLNLTSTDPVTLRIVFFVRPAYKTESEPDSQYVMLPKEFVDIARARLRGEAYKLANEDSLAAKWLADYNAHLEEFSAWLDERRPKFGL